MVVGYAYVVGDIVHTGHLLHLRNCKQLCDKLIVGVLTDRAVMEKKPCPALAFRDRIELVAALRYVDAAVAQDTYSPAANVAALRPDILFESMSHSETRYAGFEGRTLEMPYYPETSSTQIKEKIRSGQ